MTEKEMSVLECLKDRHSALKDVPNEEINKEFIREGFSAILACLMLMAKKLEL